MTTTTASAAAAEALSSLSVQQLLPMPLVFSSTATNFSSQSIRFSMATSSRLFPSSSSLEYDYQQKQLSLQKESQIATRAMDDLFGDVVAQSANNEVSSNSHLPPNLVPYDCLVIRVLFSGGFCSSSSSSSSKKLPTFNSKDFARLLSFSASSSSQKKEREFLSFPHGVTFVGKVISAGKNVQFQHEWYNNSNNNSSDVTSILPRGFREGDLVTGLLPVVTSSSSSSSSSSKNNNSNNNNKDFLCNVGSLASYITVPACFAMKIPSPQLSSVIQQHQNQQQQQQNQQNQQQQQQQNELQLSLSLVNNLLPASLWYTMFRWHVEPKKNESLLFLSVGRSAMSSTALSPALGAVLAVARFGVSLSSSSSCSSSNNSSFSTVAVAAFDEEEAILLERFEEFVRRNSPLFSATSTSVESQIGRNQMKIFQVLRWFKEEDDEKKKEVLSSTASNKKFNHVFLCDDDFSSSSQEQMDLNEFQQYNDFRLPGGSSFEDNEQLEEEQYDNDYEEQKEEESFSNSSSPSFSLVSNVLRHVLAENGTVGYLTSKLFDNPTSRISKSILPVVVEKGGRFCLVSSRTLLSTSSSSSSSTTQQPSHVIVEHREKLRRVVAESLSFLISGKIKLPPPRGRIIKADSKQVESLQKQFRQFIIEAKQQQQQNDQLQQQQQQQQEQGGAAAEGQRFLLGSRWCSLADKVGIVVGEMIQRVAQVQMSGTSSTSSSSSSSYSSSAAAAAAGGGGGGGGGGAHNNTNNTSTIVQFPF